MIPLFLPKTPDSITDEVPKENNKRRENLADQIIQLDEVDQEIHDQGVQDESARGDHEKLRERLPMSLGTLERKVVIEQVVKNRSNKRANHRGYDRVHLESVNQNNKHSVVRASANRTRRTEADKLLGDDRLLPTQVPRTP
jgi:hypothetical protein